MKVKLIVVLLLNISYAIFANGGPYYVSSIKSSGPLELKTETDIQLEREELNFFIDGDHVNVSAKYYLKNNGEKKDIDYAFLITFLADERYGNKTKLIDWYKDSKDISNIIFTFNCNEIKSSYYDEKDWTSVNDSLYIFSNKSYKRWYTAKLNFDENTNNVLEVNYKISSYFINDNDHHATIPECTDRYFIYDLFPSSYWGNEIVNNYRMTINIKDLKNKLGDLISYPKGGKWINDTEYILEKINYNLKEAEEIKIIYDNKYEFITKIIDPLVKKGKGSYAVEVSSELPSTKSWNYSKNNLIDGDLTTAWVEGSKGFGIGEEINIEVEPKRGISYIGLINGFTLNEKTYYENARVKKLKLEIITYEDSFIKLEQPYVKDFDIPDISYTYFDEDNYSKFQIPLFNCGEPPNIKKIKIKILDIYPGNKYEDLCISEILLGGYW